MTSESSAAQKIDFDSLSYPVSFADAAKIIRAATGNSDVSKGALHAVCIELGWLTRGRHHEVAETVEGRNNGVVVVDRTALLSRTGFSRMTAFFPATFWV